MKPQLTEKDDWGLTHWAEWLWLLGVGGVVLLLLVLELPLGRRTPASLERTVGDLLRPSVEMSKP